jgi:HlyD family secretion protein
MTRTAVRSGSGVRVAAAASLVLMVTVGVAACGSTPSAPPTTTVQRGSVSTMVSASGSLSSVTSQNLGFAKAARLAELDVKVGDTVKPGQLLAREDPFAFQQLLNEQQAELANQQALLNKAVNDVSVPDAQHLVDAAQRIYEKTKDASDAKNRFNDNAVNRARVAVNFTQRVLRQAKAKAVADGCSEVSGYRRSSDGGGQVLSSLLGGGSTTGGSTTGGMSGTTGGTGGGTTSGMGGSGLTTGGTAGSTTSGMTTPVSPDPCPADVTAYNTAKTNEITAETTYQQNKRTRDVDETQGRLNVATERQQLVTEQNLLDAAATDRPSNIAAQAALVANEAALVAQSQRDLHDTALFAPVGGTISAITGTVGEYEVAAGGGTTALAPGSNAAIPGVGAAATSDQSGNASSGISATRPGGGFIVLNNINTYQVVVPFEESDAAKVAANQKVKVTFDAIPDLERDGTVLSIAPNGVNISGVTNYYATILLTNTDPRLKDGQTAEASVVTSSLNNVLVVPNSAIIRSGGQPYVNVPGPDGKPKQVPVTLGVVGDDNTQVLGGLSEGQQILMPQAGASPATGTGGHGGG